MRAGTLRERVTFQKRVPSGGDASWGPPMTWVDQATVWASVEAESGSESAGDHEVATAVVYTIRVRFLADVTNTWRIVWNGRTLDIVSVIDPNERGRELEIKAVENVANA